MVCAIFHFHAIFTVEWERERFFLGWQVGLTRFESFPFSPNAHTRDVPAFRCCAPGCRASTAYQLSSARVV